MEGETCTRLRGQQQGHVAPSIVFEKNTAKVLRQKNYTEYKRRHRHTGMWVEEQNAVRIEVGEDVEFRDMIPVNNLL